MNIITKTKSLLKYLFKKILLIFSIILFFFMLSSCNIPSTGKSLDQLNREQTKKTAVEEMVEMIKTASSSPSEIEVTSSATQTVMLNPLSEDDYFLHMSTPTLEIFLPTPTATLSAEYFHGTYIYEHVPYISQRGLTYQGRKTNSGCTAASIEMILDFWHQYNSEYKTMKAQALLDLNAKQGNFVPGVGLAALDTKDELDNLGYYIGYQIDSIKEDLLDALVRYGPIALVVKTNWDPNGTNHSAVLTGYDNETDQVMINDPWSKDKIIKMSYDQFDSIWGLNYAAADSQVEARRIFFFIVPYQEIRPDHDLFIP